MFSAGREYFEGLEKQKAIESFEVGIAGPAAPADIGAFWMVRGTEDQLRAVRESKEFRRLMVRAAMAIENIRVVRFLIGGKPLLELLQNSKRRSKIWRGEPAGSRAVADGADYIGGRRAERGDREH